MGGGDQLEVLDRSSVVLIYFRALIYFQALIYFRGLIREALSLIYFRVLIYFRGDLLSG